MRKKGLLFVCFFALVVICFMSLPPVARSSVLVNTFEKAKNAVTGAVDKGGTLLRDIINGETEGKIYLLEVVAPGRLISQGFRDVKRGDTIHLQILNYDENIFEICTEDRLQCATFALDDKGRMIRTEYVPGTK